MTDEGPKEPSQTEGNTPPAPPPGGWQQPPPWAWQPPPTPGPAGWQAPPPGWQPQPGGWQAQPGQYPPGYGPPPHGPPPPPPYGYGPPPYYPPVRPGPPPPQTDTTAIIALSLAVGSFMFWFIGPILAIVSLVLCSSATDKIRASNGRLEGEGLVKGARIVSWVNIGISALFLLILIAAIVIGAAVDDTNEEFDLSVTIWRLLR